MGRCSGLRAVALATAISLLPLACSTSAIITRSNGREVQGEIIDGSRSAITVRDSDGEVRRIPRTDIESIVHPGAAAFQGGVALLAFGVIAIFLGAQHCAERGGAALCGAVVLPATVGLGMMTWGGAAWSRSAKVADSGATDAAVTPGGAGPPASQAPPIPRPSLSPMPAPAPPPAPPPPVPSIRQRTDDEDG